MAAVGSKNAVINSRLLVFNLKKGTKAAEIPYDNTMLLRIQFNKNGGLTAVGDNRYDVYDSKFNAKETLSFTENVLISVAFDDDGNGVVCLAENGGSKTSVNAISSNGTKRFQQVLDGAVQAASVSGNTTALLIGRTVTVLDKAGAVKNTFTAGAVPEAMIIAGADIYTIEEDTVAKY